MKNIEDEVSKLIDLMALNEAHDLNEQLKELESQELRKQQIQSQINNNNNNNQSGNKVFSFLGLNKDKDSLIDMSGNQSSSSSNNNGLNDSMSNYFQTSFTELINKASDDFEKEWDSVFGNAKQQQQHQQPQAQNLFDNLPTSPEYTSDQFDFDKEFSLFKASQVSPSNQNNLTESNSSSSTSKQSKVQYNILVFIQIES
jgi:hypothetical protein